jgi:hypothetical protein
MVSRRVYHLRILPLSRQATPHNVSETVSEKKMLINISDKLNNTNKVLQGSDTEYRGRHLSALLPSR